MVPERSRLVIHTSGDKPRHSYFRKKSTCKWVAVGIMIGLVEKSG